MKPTYPKTRFALGAILLVPLFASSVRAPAADLKTINFEESYLVSGQPVTLRQNLGEVVIKLNPATAESVSEIRTAANGNYAQSRKLDKQSAMFSTLPPTQPTVESSQSAIDDLNADSRLVYAYPVFVNPASGKRVFLNDEIVVSFNQSPADVLGAIDPALGLTRNELLSGSEARAGRITGFPPIPKWGDNPIVDTGRED